MEKVATLLWGLRTARKWSLGELARQAGISKAAISQWESGYRQPRIPELEAVLSALNADTAQRTRLLAAIEAPRALRQLRKTAIVEPPTVGDLLRSLRHRKGWTQEQLASALHVTRTAVGHWEQGERMPSTEQIHEICYMLDAHEEELVALSTGRCPQKPTLSTAQDWGETQYGIEQRWQQLKSDGVGGLDELAFWTLERQVWEHAVQDPSAIPLLAKIYATHAQYFRTHRRWSEIAPYTEKAMTLLDSTQEVTTTRLWVGILRSTAAVYGRDKPTPQRGVYLLSSEVELAGEFPEYQAWMLADMAKYMALDGQAEAGLELTARAIEIARNTNRTEYIMRQIDHVRLLLQMGRSTEALRILPQEDTFRLVSARAEVSLLSADAHLRDGNPSEAANSFQKATDLIEQHNLVALRPEADLLAAQF